MRRQVLALAAANSVALAAAVFAYFGYSRLLGPEQFALLFGAIAMARFCTLVLDGGVKMALIKHPGDITPGTRRALFRGSVVTAAAVIALMAVVLSGLTLSGRLESSHALFLGCYAGAYLTTYPSMLLPLAQLERERQFEPVALWESVSVAAEYLVPLLFWTILPRSVLPFIAAAWLARGVRMWGVRYAGRRLPGADDGSVVIDWRGAAGIFREGGKVQIALALSMVRDNLHYLLVGPMFGRQWVGYYSWTLQLTSVTSQVFVQTASRVALPVLRTAVNEGSQWTATVTQMRWLAIFTLPLVAFLYHFADVADEVLFHDKWSVAVVLVPAIAIRLLPGIATTGLGFLVLAQRGGGSFVSATLKWTLAEIGLALAGLLVFGPAGLAYSYAVAAWFGVLAYGREIRGGRLAEVLSTLFLRPSLAVSAPASIILYAVREQVTTIERVAACAVLVALSLVAEREVRVMLGKLTLRRQA